MSPASSSSSLSSAPASPVAHSPTPSPEPETTSVRSAPGPKGRPRKNRDASPDEAKAKRRRPAPRSARQSRSSSHANSTATSPVTLDTSSAKEQPRASLKRSKSLLHGQDEKPDSGSKARSVAKSRKSLPADTTTAISDMRKQVISEVRSATRRRRVIMDEDEGDSRDGAQSTADEEPAGKTPASHDAPQERIAAATAKPSPKAKPKPSPLPQTQPSFISDDDELTDPPSSPEPAMPRSRRGDDTVMSDFADSDSDSDAPPAKRPKPAKSHNRSTSTVERNDRSERNDRNPSEKPRRPEPDVKRKPIKKTPSLQTPPTRPSPAGTPNTMSPAHAAPRTSLLASTLSKLSKPVPTPDKPVELKEERRAGTWGEEFILTPEQEEQYAASKAAREAAAAERGKGCQHPLNLQEAKDAYRAYRAECDGGIMVEGGMGIVTTGMPSRMVAAVLEGRVRGR